MPDDQDGGAGGVAAPGAPATPTLPRLDRPGGFLASSGLVFDEVSGVRVTGHLDVGPEHHTPWGVVHGGVYTTAVESAASVGASAAVLDQGQYAVGVNNNTDFLRPMARGRLDVLAEPVSQGRVQQLWRVTLRRPEDGKLVAQGTVRLQNLPRR